MILILAIVFQQIFKSMVFPNSDKILIIYPKFILNFSNASWIWLDSTTKLSNTFLMSTYSHSNIPSIYSLANTISYQLKSTSLRSDTVRPTFIYLGQPLKTDSLPKQLQNLLPKQ